MINNIWAIVPAYNEEKRIADTIDGLKRMPDVKIMIVDDCSQDKTIEKARNAGADIIVPLASNGGKGNALNRGIEALDKDARIVLFIDADLGSCSEEAGKLLQPLLAGKADMTIGIFPKAVKKGGFGLVKGLARYSVKLLGKIEVSSPLSGQRALSRKLVDDVFPLAEGYGIEVGLTIDAARKGYRISEVPVRMTHNETGRDLSGFKHRGKQFVQILGIVIKKIFIR